MKTLRLTVLAAALVMAVSGCASKHMDVATIGPNDVVLAKNQAAVVFFRDTILGAAIQAPVVEIVDKDVAFVGIVSANTKLLHKTTPGRHVYIVGGEGSHRVEADLAPQKFYYVRVAPKMGAWKASFELEPVDAADEKLPKALSGCTWIAPGTTSQAWFNDNKASLLDKGNTAQESKGNLRPGKSIWQYGFSDRLIQ